MATVAESAENILPFKAKKSLLKKFFFIGMEMTRYGQFLQGDEGNAFV